MVELSFKNDVCIGMKYVFFFFSICSCLKKNNANGEQ
jgi:hypothetical protein